MRTRSLLFLSILVISIYHASPKDKVLKEKISSGGQERTYYLFVPETLDPGWIGLQTTQLQGYICSCDRKNSFFGRFYLCNGRFT